MPTVEEVPAPADNEAATAEASAAAASANSNEDAPKDEAPAPQAAAAAPTQQGGIVSSENSVASNTKLATTATTSNKNETPKVEPQQQLTPTDNAMLLKMSAPPHHPVAEFLFQLTKMLTDDNKEFIEWKGGGILVHDPPGLEKDILPKYFRHSNYSSFQRQMNYFGFRKIAGKGKMSACSYVNEHATEDISSLLYIKRKKAGVSGTAAKLLAQANKLSRAQAMHHQQQQVNMNPMMMMQNPMMNNQFMQNPMMMMQNSMALMQQQQQQVAMMNGMNLQGLPNTVMPMMNMLPQGVMTAPTQGKMNVPQGVLPAAAQVNPASLRDQQQGFLAQLQQAHASASNQVGQGKLENGTAPIMTNDQGNIYSAPQTQAFLMQQAAAMGAPAEEGDGGAKFRSFINQQISLSQQPQAGAVGMPPNMMVMPQGQMNLPQGLSYEQFFQLNGMNVGDANAPAGQGS